MKHELEERIRQTSAIIPEEFSSDWENVFGNDKPIKVEIGSGKGEFILRKAQSEPEYNFLAIEMRRQRVLKIQSKIDRKKIENVRVIYANAKKDLAKLFFENSIDTFYVHFPDPWPKKKHAVRRLFEKTFLQDIIHRTKDFGKIYLTTDVDYYAEDVGEFFSSLKTCKKLYFHKNDFESPEHSTIHEWKFKQWGRDIYYFCYQKVID